MTWRRPRRRPGDAGRRDAQPGGWNRFSIEVPDLPATVAQLQRDGVRFRNKLVTGVGGRQIIADDPPATR